MFEETTLPDSSQSKKHDYIHKFERKNNNYTEITGTLYPKNRNLIVNLLSVYPIPYMYMPKVLHVLNNIK